MGLMGLILTSHLLPLTSHLLPLPYRHAHLCRGTGVADGIYHRADTPAHDDRPMVLAKAEAYRRYQPRPATVFPPVGAVSVPAPK